MKAPCWQSCAHWIVRFLSTSSKATTRKEFVSSLHQAVVEVITLKTSLQSLSTDLSQISYTPDALASIAATTIELDDTGKQIALKYQEAGRETILGALSGNPEDVQDLSVSEAKDFEAEVESLESGNDLASDSGEQAQEVTAHQDNFGAEEADRYQDQAVTENIKVSDGESERSSGDNAGQLDSKTRSSYTVTSLRFLTLPLGSLELRFAVSHGSLKPTALLIQELPGNQKIVSVDRASHTRSPVHLCRDFDAHLQLSLTKQQCKAEKAG